MSDDNQPWRDQFLDRESGTGLLGQTLRNVAALIGAGLFAAWIFSGGLGSGEPPARPAEPAAPPRAPAQLARAPEAGGYELVVPPSAGGHFLVEAQVNGIALRFLVDTGASVVLLSAEDARRLGFHPANLEFSERFETANGEIRGAPVVLRELRLGDLRLDDLEARVTEAPLPISLLGISFLQRLAGYEVGPAGLVLHW